MDSDFPEPLRHFLAQLDELRSASIPACTRCSVPVTPLISRPHSYGEQPLIPAIGSSTCRPSAHPRRATRLSHLDAPARTGGEAGGAAGSGVVSGGGAGGWNSWRLTRRRNT